MTTDPHSIPLAQPDTDEAFWLARLDADLHRASLVPDRRRTSSEPRHYASVPFAVDPSMAGTIRSLDPTTGVSDLALYTTLVAVLLAKYHRDDELIVGLQWSGRDGEAGLRPMLLPCNPESTAATLIGEVAGEVAKLLDRPSGALAHLAQALGMTRSDHRCPLFDIAIAVGDGSLRLGLQASPVDVVFVFTIAEGVARGEIRYAEELFERATMERAALHLHSLSAELAQRPHESLRSLGMLSSDERQLLLHEFNRRSADYPLRRTIHELIEEQCRKTPDAVAAVHCDVELTYDELNRRANRLAHTLMAKSLGKGDFVCILLPRSCDFLVAMLASFKAGAAYVPLDPTYPRERVEYMLRDSAAAVLVSNQTLLSKFADVIDNAPALNALVALDTDAPPDAMAAAHSHVHFVGRSQLANASDANPDLALTGSDRAYMIYTSGSTGRPKGAICRHDGALNHLFGELDGIGVHEPFRFLQSAASSSDISVWQLVAPLIFGGSTVIADYEVIVDPPALFSMLRDQRVNVAEPVPVVLRALIDHAARLSAAERALSDLHCMMVTGEALPAELVDRWLALYPHIPVANTYGPTETSDDVTLCVMREPIAARCAVAPIGLPLPNVRLFILDRELQPVPVGVPGEICVGGVAVGEGYWRQPDKTEGAFVPCPFADVAPGPMYRTGDLGRWLADGQIEFFGRVDQQVKVRGFRVEPGEIEASITRHPAVQDAAVVLAETGPASGRLIGFYVLHQGQQLGAAELRTYLKDMLAEHMIPATLTPLAGLPRTPLGKLDRKALASTQHPTTDEEAEHVSPRTPTEKVLAAIWAEVVGTPHVSATDNFFEIGGDSMSTIEVVVQLREAGYHLASWDLFQQPVLCDLARLLDATMQAPSSANAPVRSPPWDDVALRQRVAAAVPGFEDAYPLSGTQRGIYYQTLLLPKGSGAYIEQVAFDVEGDLDARAFELAWQHVVAATDVLRTAVVRLAGQQPAQVVMAAAGFKVDGHDMRGRPPSAQASAVESLLATERTRGFDLKKPPLMRVAVVRLGTSVARVVWTYHHVILDGWSEGLVLGAVFRAYAAIRNSAVPNQASPARYRDFVAWSEAQDFSAAETFWRGTLAGFTSPAVIKDVSPAITPPAGGEILHGWCDITLSAAATKALEETTRRLGVTTATIIHAAWSLLLHRATGLADVVFGSVASGRGAEVPHIDKMAGLVVVTQPLRSRPSGEATIGSWLRLLQLQMAEMREHEHTPLALIQGWSDVPVQKRPLFDSIVVVGNYAGHDLSQCAAETFTIGNVLSYTQPLYALTLFVVPGTSLTMRLVFDKKRYAASTVAALLDEYRRLLNAMVENPEQRLVNLGRMH